MFKLDQGKTKLEFWFQGYEAPEHRYHGDDDSWAGFHAIVTTEAFSFESNGSDVESCAIDSFEKLLNDFLNGKMDENRIFSPIEEGFEIHFYPKGKFYGQVYDSKNNLIIKKEAELSVYIPEDNWFSPASIKFVLDEEDVKQLHEYIKHIISNEI